MQGGCGCGCDQCNLSLIIPYETRAKEYKLQQPTLPIYMVLVARIIMQFYVVWDVSDYAK